MLPAAYYELYKWYPPGNSDDGRWMDSHEVTVNDSLLSADDLRHFGHASRAFEIAVEKILDELPKFDGWKCHKAPNPDEEASLSCIGAYRRWYMEMRTTGWSLRLLTPRDPIDRYNGLLYEWKVNKYRAGEVRDGAWWMDSDDCSCLCACIQRSHVYTSSRVVK